MFNAAKSRALLAVADLLGLLAVGFGLVFAVYGMASGFHAEALYGAVMAGGGLSWLIATLIGRAVVHIAETNSQILKKLSEK